MYQYLDLLREVKETGVRRSDRTGVGTVGVFGRQLRFDLAAGFPVVTTKKMFWPGIVYELLWFLRGETNIGWLTDRDVHIWDEWADEAGELGPVYGYQWRSWPTSDGEAIDQISWVIEEIQHNPYSRRLLVSAWNVGELERMALHPCHVLFQFYVANDRLSCQLYQRSADIFLGLPFNIASYSLLTLMVAQATGLQPGEFVHTLGDAHIYLNHLDQVDLQLSRTPYPSPRVELNPAVDSIADFTIDDVQLIGYQSHPTIKAPIAV